MADMKGRKCPNCNGAVREISNGKFVCESCGTSFTTDAPQEDDELRRLRAEAEEKKRQLEAAISSRGAKKSNGSDTSNGRPVKPVTYAAPGGYARPGGGRSGGSSSHSKIIAIVLIVVIVWFVIFAVIIRGIVGITSMTGKYGTSAEKFLEQQKAEQEERIKKEQEKIEQRQREQEERIKQEEEAARKLWESYQVTTEDVLKDETFVKNAKPALRSALDYRNNLVWTNWIWETEPEYLTSYLLVAEDQNSRHKNMLVSFYVVHWTWDLGDKKENFDVYDATVLYDISLKDDGTMKSDYKAQEFSNHTELPKNQFLNGYFDLDQLYRESILAKSDYKVTEFDFSDEK